MKKIKKTLCFAMLFAIVMVNTFGGCGKKATAADLENNTELQEAENVMKSITEENKFLIQAKRISSSKVKLTWKQGKENFSFKVYKKVKNAKNKKYDEGKCIATTTANTYTVSGLSKRKQYQFYVTVFCILKDETGENQKLLAKSVPLTITTGTNHFLDVKTVIAKRNKVEIPAGKTHKIRCRVKMQGNKVTYKKPKLSYYSTNKSSVTVNNKGIVSAVKKGTAVVFVMAPSGAYDKVYIIVK